MQGIEDERHQAWPGNDDNITIIIIIIIGYSFLLFISTFDHLWPAFQQFKNI